MSRAKGRTQQQKKEKPPPKLNQFGKRMAVAEAVPTLVTLWRCSECGALSPGTNEKPPFRCSNRKTCGRLFHGVTE